MQIEDFLPVGGIMGITAYPGVGKSWLALEVMRSVGSGFPFVNKFKSRRGGVLFVGSDSSLYDYARQWTRLTSHVEAAAHIFEPVRFLVQSAFMFEDRDEVRRLIATHRNFEWGLEQDTPEGPQRERGFHTIIFDTVSKLTRANQNDNTEMEEVFRHIRWIAEATNAAVVLIHHNSKRNEFNDGSDWRGALSQIGALDSWVQLTPSAREKYVINCQFKKFRGITPQDFVYRMEVSDPLRAALVFDEEHTKTARGLKESKIGGSNDTTSNLITAALAGDVKKSIPQIVEAVWPKVTPSSGNDVTYADPKKLDRAIRNRMPTLLVNGVILREADVTGKPTYYLKDKTCVPSPSEMSTGESTDSSVSSQQPASPSGVKVRKTRSAKGSKSSKSVTSETSDSAPSKATPTATRSRVRGASRSSGATTTEQ